MQFIIANTFLDSVARLQGPEQSAAKLAAMEMQMNPAHPSLKMHRLDKAKDKNFWSARVNDDVRLIVHRTEDSCLLCYVAHHDPAYAWAERRKLSVHPTTGAAQMVVLKETVQEIIIRKYVEVAEPEPTKSKSLLASSSDSDLLSYGVPSDWLVAVRRATEDTVLDIAGYLPEEARDAVLNLATGVKPTPFPKIEEPPTWKQLTEAILSSKPSIAVAPDVGVGMIELAKLAPLQKPRKLKAFDAFAHPDAQRRFRTISNVEELRRALDAPWEKWMVFLHPAQRLLVEREFKGPAKVSGSAGTGKTIVALHRAVHLAEAYPTSRVLLTTFSSVLADALRAKLRLLIGNRPRLGEQIEVLPMHDVALRLYASNLAVTYGPTKLATMEAVSTLLGEAAVAVGEVKFSQRFLCQEWEQVIDAWQLKTWEEYRDVTRMGRRTRLREPQRQALWAVFAVVLQKLGERREMTEAEMFTRLAKHYAEGGAPPLDFAVVDEAQDVSIAELRCLAGLSGGRPNSLFLAGDTGQRIFQQPFSWKSVGVDVCGRATTLKVNYRTSHQIRAQADRLLETKITDVDGNEEDRSGTVSVFDGPVPEIIECASQADEIATVADWLKNRAQEGLRPDEMVLFVRSDAELPRAQAAADAAGIACKALDRFVEIVAGRLLICTMHLAKGLEFRAVAVMACDEGILPLQERLETSNDPSDLEEIYNTERQLLYVACTRARDHLLLTSAGISSEFLRDFESPSP